MKYILSLTFIFTLTACSSSQKTEVSEERLPSSLCTTNKCKLMGQLEKNLIESKYAYDALPANKKKNPNVPTEQWPKPSREEIAYDMATGKVSIFVCDYSVKKSKKKENQKFITFVLNTFDNMTGVSSSDMASCFENTYRTNQKILEPIVNAQGALSSIQSILEEGKPRAGDHQ